jgi:transposase
MGEDVSDLLDMIAAQMKVLQIARIKKSCRRCEKMVQEPAPSRPIPGSMAPLGHVNMPCRAVDDTPIRVLDRSLRDKGLGKGVKQGRIWAYVRDKTIRHVAAIGSRANGGRAGSSPPGAVYRFAPNWKEEHVLSHLANARGILQAPLGTSRCDALPGNGWLQGPCQTLRS